MSMPTFKGKGSIPRKSNISKEEMDERWEMAFGKKKKKKKEKAEKKKDTKDK
jgi:hypothetical protein